MKKWMGYLGHFYRNRVYMLLLSVTALFSYGFMVTHYTIGIDDTPYAYYFEEGLAAIVGRWVLFLLNKAVDIAQFAPFLTDFAGVLLLMAAVTVWCVLFYSVLGEKVPDVGYSMFACIFLSSPLLSEVFTYYLHNGVALGYLCSGVSLCFFKEGLCRAERNSLSGEGRRSLFRRLSPFLASGVFLWMALGCYESFMTVWLLGLCLLLLCGCLAEDRRRIFLSLCMGALVSLTAVLLRSAMIFGVTAVFGLEELRDEAVQRSVAELAGWVFQPGAASEFAMVLKRIFVMYGVFAYAYYPIKVFVLAAAVIWCVCLIQTIRKKNFRILLLCVGSFAAAFLLVVVEGKATLYRSAQFLPVICGFGALLLVYACKGAWSGRRAVGSQGAGSGRGTGGGRGTVNREIRKAGSLLEVGRAAEAAERLRAVWQFAVTAVLCMILWNQCTDMNNWFYVDYMKYQAARETMSQVAYELEKKFDTSKPVVFTGTYEIPESLVKDAYVEYNSEIFYKMLRVTSLVDEHLLEKFYRDYGVWVAQTPSLSVIEWGRYAFGTDEELVRFAAMHGHELKPLSQREYGPIEEYSKGLPEFPKEGSIVDAGEYLIVHF